MNDQEAQGTSSTGEIASSQFFAQRRFERLDIFRTACCSSVLNAWAQLGCKTGSRRLGQRLVPNDAGRQLLLSECGV